MACNPPAFFSLPAPRLDNMPGSDASWIQWSRWACAADVACPLLGPNHELLARLGAAWPLARYSLFYILECPLEGPSCFDFSVGCPVKTVPLFFTPEQPSAFGPLLEQYAWACRNTTGEKALCGTVFLEMDVSRGNQDWSLFLDLRDCEDWLVNLGDHVGHQSITSLLRLLSGLKPSCALRHLGFMASCRSAPLRLVLKASAGNELWTTLSRHGLSPCRAARDCARAISEHGTCWLDLDVNADGSLGPMLGLEWIPPTPPPSPDDAYGQLVALLAPDRGAAKRLSCLQTLLGFQTIAPVQYQTSLSHCKWRWCEGQALPEKVYVSVRSINNPFPATFQAP